MMKAIVIVLMLAGMAWGQTTKPTNGPTVEQLIAVNHQLSAKISELQREIDALRKQLAQLIPTAKKTDAGDRVAKAIENNDIVTGMTTEQVKKVAENRKCFIRSQDRSEYQAGGRTVLAEDWTIVTDPHGGVAECRFENGILQSYSKRKE